MPFHFRVHLDVVDLDKLIEFIKKNAKIMVIVREKGSRLHIHSVIEPNKTLSTFRQNFKKKFPNVDGNKDYSLEQVKDNEKMIAYCCKGENNETKPDVLVSNIDTDAYHKQYWEVNEKLKENSNGGTKKKVKTLTWIQEVKKGFEEEYPVDVYILSNPIEAMWKPTEQEIETYIASRKKLLGYILQRLGKSVKVLDDNILARLFRGISNSYIQDGNKTEDYTEYMYNKLGL